MEDRSGILWVGTYGGGVNKVVPTSGIFEHDKSDPGEAKSPFADLVYSVAEDRFGTVWAGTEAGLKRLEAGEPSGSLPAAVSRTPRHS
jgi:ligand-binding sensor domain-containing protein